jgi:hypothetical protein
MLSVINSVYLIGFTSNFTKAIFAVPFPAMVHGTLEKYS